MALTSCLIACEQSTIPASFMVDEETPGRFSALTYLPNGLWCCPVLVQYWTNNAYIHRACTAISGSIQRNDRLCFVNIDLEATTS